MKRFTQLIILFLLFIGVQNTYSQCTPADSISCPDPEGNGQICPRTPDTVYIGVEYIQDITILPPPQIETNNMVITINHITLKDVGNLPEGITWTTNAENNIFMADTYYCLQLSGTSNAATGAYHVKITVEAFTKIGNTVVSLGETVDSTSISIIVAGNSNDIAENKKASSTIDVWPNPFSSVLNIALLGSQNEAVEIEVFNITGKRMYHKKHYEYPLKYEANLYSLPDGIYLLSIKHKNNQHLKKIIKHRY